MTARCHQRCSPDKREGAGFACRRGRSSCPAPPPPRLLARIAFLMSARACAASRKKVGRRRAVPPAEGTRASELGALEQIVETANAIPAIAVRLEDHAVPAFLGPAVIRSQQVDQQSRLVTLQ